MKRTFTLSLLGGVLLSACADAATAPDLRVPEPALSRAAGAAGACRAKADVVVRDEAGLRAALAAAAPGHTIAIDGTIGVTSGVNVTTEGLTLTCATPGSGLRVDAAADASTMIFLLSVWAADVTVEGLTLDGTGLRRATYYSFNDGGHWASARNNRFVGNRVVCGADECAFWIGSMGAVVTDNQVESNGTSTGLHFQGGWNPQTGEAVGIDGTRIERNRIHNSGVSPRGYARLFGGIRPRDGRGVTVANNVITGTWENSISSVALSDSDIQGNRLEGARQYGLAINVAGRSGFAIGNRVAGNQVEHSGRAGIFVRRACSNAFAGNNLQRAGEFAAMFDATTGDNALAGNTRDIADNGAYDCDGDGAADPNRLAGRTRRGLQIGELTTPLPAASAGAALR